jgi:nucleotide-binding universal stress UspA family protein
MFYSKILVAYDGSELSEKALDKAVGLARKDKRIELYVLYVIRYAYKGIVTPVISDSMESEFFDRNTIFCRDVITEAEKKVDGLSNVFVTYMKGDPGKKILKHAKQHHCDVIMMGSRGLMGFKKLVLRSVSHYVTQHADIPVLIVK